MIGTAVGWFALTVWLSQQIPTQEELGAKLALLGIAGSIATVIGALVAGAWADRHDRKRTMLVCDLLSALLSLVLVWLLLSGLLVFPLVLVIGFLYPLLGAFHS